MDRKHFRRFHMILLKGMQGIKGKRELCLLLAWLLLFMATGCSQVTPQIPDASATVSSSSIETESGIPGTSVTASPGSIETESGIPGTSNTEANSISSDSVASLNDDVSSTTENSSSSLPEDGSYTSKEDVALYIHLYGHLPPNFITKKEAEALGWKGGSLEPYAPGMCIGGNRFGNYECLLPEKDGRSYTECDIDTLGADKRGAKRIVFSNDGLVYYTEDHYESFELLYGETDP